jgi:hypothetical protein
LIEHRSRPVGRVTVALALIGGGVLLLGTTLGLLKDPLVLLRLWPLLLVSLGVENLLSRLRGDSRRFDWVGLLLLALFLTATGVGSAVWSFLETGRLPVIFLGVASGGIQTDLQSMPAAGVRRVELVDEQATKVDLTGQAGDQIQVEATFRGQRAGTRIPTVDLRVEGDTVRIGYKQGDWQEVGVQYRVILPPGLQVVVRNSHGQVRVANVTGDLQVENQSGPVFVERGEGSLQLSTSSGLVEVDGFGGPVRLEAHSGAVRMRNLAGPVTARSSSGLISLQLVPHADVQIDAETSSGIIRGPAWLAVHGGPSGQTATGRLGNGTNPVRLETHSGAITIAHP